MYQQPPTTLQLDLERGEGFALAWRGQILLPENPEAPTVAEIIRTLSAFSHALLPW